MSNIIKHDNNQQALYIQSVEKQQDSLTLRKKIAHELWLTSIGEFIQWWAVAYKDERRRLVNEQGEYMRDPIIKNLEHKRIDTSPKWYIWFSHKEGNINGNGDFVEKEEDNTDIIQSKHWIFSAKEGIIIVVDDRWFCKARLYGIDGRRIPIPLWWDLDPHAIPDREEAYSIYDDFSKLRNYIQASTDINSSVFDWRKGIVHGRFAVDLSQKTRENLYFYDPQQIKKQHNLFNNCAYNFVDTKGEFFVTSLGDCYANTKRPFDGSCGLMPCVHWGLSDGTTRKDEQYDYDIKRPVFYAVDMEWQAFKDEFGNIVMFDDPYRLNNFDQEWFAPIVIDKAISPIRLWGDSPHPYTEYSAYICFISTSGKYRKSDNGKFAIIPFYKTQREHTVTSNDVRWYTLFPELGIIEVRQLSITEPWFRWVNKEIYKYFDYYGKQVDRHKYFNYNGQQRLVHKIDWWDTEERIHKMLSDELIIYWYGTKIDHESPRWWLNSYWWDAKIVNTKIDYKNIQFPDGKDVFNYDFDTDFDKFWKSFIFSGNHVDPRWWRTYECVKINGLVARYIKDEEGQELKSIGHMIVSVDQKYLFIQRKDWDPYYILNQSFAYIKDKDWKKLAFPREPFYIDGVFLMYDIKQGQEGSWQKDCDLIQAYFEDGTLVGGELSIIDTKSSISLTGKQEILKSLK